MELIGGGGDATQAGSSSSASIQIQFPIISSSVEGGSQRNSKAAGSVVSSTPGENLPQDFSSEFEKTTPLTLSKENINMDITLNSERNLTTNTSKG